MSSSLVPFALTVWICVYVVKTFLHLHPPTLPAGYPLFICRMYLALPLHLSIVMVIFLGHFSESASLHCEVGLVKNWGNQNTYNCQQEHDWCQKEGFKWRSSVMFNTQLVLSRCENALFLTWLALRCWGVTSDSILTFFYPLSRLSGQRVDP